MILRFIAFTISLIGILFAIPSIASINLEDQRNLSVPKGLDDIVLLIRTAQSDFALNKKDAELEKILNENQFKTYKAWKEKMKKNNRFYS